MPRNPFNIDYSGALYRAFPGPWQVFMQDVFIVCGATTGVQFERAVMEAHGSCDRTASAQCSWIQSYSVVSRSK
eukprot:3284632-Amphidinium_carterae.2